MKRVLPLALVALAVAAAPASAAKCQKRKGETVVARSSSAIVTRAGKSEADWVYRGCLFRRGHRYRLLAQGNDYPFSGDVLDQVKLRGPYAGLVVDYFQKGDTQVDVSAFDLRNGRTRAVLAGVDYDQGSHYTLERFALSEHGAIAWRGTVTDETGIPAPIQSISIADSHGTRQLDSGAPGSLGGPLFPDPRIIAWSSHGSARSARAFYGLPRQN